MNNILTINDCQKRGGDNFLFLRLLAATAVIYGHSYALVSEKAGADFVLKYIKHTHIAHEAVSVFFVISGFLVAGSFVSRNNIFFFIKSRILRIFPGLLVCLLLTAFCLGPLVSTFTIGEYFNQEQTYRYVLNNLLMIKPDFFLPGVFEQNRLAGVNGSLWTLPAEIRVYLILAVVGFLGFLKNKLVFNTLLFSAIFIGCFFPDSFPLLSHNPKYFRLGAMFALGVFFYIHRDSVPLHGGILTLIGLLCVLAFDDKKDFMLVFSLFLAYSAIFIAYACRPIEWINRHVPDISYGLYIYAFPIQQTCSFLMPELSPYGLFFYSLIATSLLAFLSWHFIEKHALKLKNLRIFPQ